MHPLLNCRLVLLTRISGLAHRRCRVVLQSSVDRPVSLFNCARAVVVRPPARVARTPLYRAVEMGTVVKFPTITPVSYTHLTLPTNREV